MTPERWSNATRAANAFAGNAARTTPSQGPSDRDATAILAETDRARVPRLIPVRTNGCWPIHLPSRGGRRDGRGPRISSGILVRPAAIAI